MIPNVKATVILTCFGAPLLKRELEGFANEGTQLNIEFTIEADTEIIKGLVKQRDTLIEAIKAALEESPVSRELLQAALKEVQHDPR